MVAPNDGISSGLEKHGKTWLNLQLKMLRKLQNPMVHWAHVDKTDIILGQIRLNDLIPSNGCNPKVMASQLYPGEIQQQIWGFKQNWRFNEVVFW